jgi:hypothetical protein
MTELPKIYAKEVIHLTSGESLSADVTYEDVTEFESVQDEIEDFLGGTEGFFTFKVTDTHWACFPFKSINYIELLQVAPPEAAVTQVQSTLPPPPQPPFEPGGIVPAGGDRFA